MLKLLSSISLSDLYKLDNLKILDQEFLKLLNNADKFAFDALISARNAELSKKDEQKLIIKLAPFLERFIALLFGIESEIEVIRKKHLLLEVLISCQKNFVQRRVAKQLCITNEVIYSKIEKSIVLLKQEGVLLDSDLNFAESVTEWQKDEERNAHLISAAEIYTAWALQTEDGRAQHKNSVLFKIPHKKNYENLIDRNVCNTNARIREDFTTHSKDTTLEHSVYNANYCIYCHNQEKDFCSIGAKNKSYSDKNFSINPLTIELTGCPLEEKISAMNYLKKQGYIVGALATAVVDNPMVAATGYRICNDCMKSCIYVAGDSKDSAGNAYQKQLPVDIPLIETENLDQVLNLPYGFEIYSLLTRWNPLKFKHYLPKEINKYKILIAGLGPAGFTLAHYLLNAGFTVVAIDGLKIEPLAPEISGIDQLGRRHDFKEIKDINYIYDDLKNRVPQGFGGVMEYGITSRWNKNYLKVIRLLLERRENFRMYDSTRFGSSIDYSTAASLEFDHIALALGAGKPNIPDIPNLLVKGVRTASDFLMTLQLLGSHLEGSIASLQIRLPILVIGGGLTAIDAAAESLAYYPLQVERFLRAYEKLGPRILDHLNEEELEIAQEFIMHAAIIREAPEKKLMLLKKWGGVKVIYHKSIQESPSYRLNHEEVQKTLEEGVEFIDNIVPTEIEVDRFGGVSLLKHQTGSMKAKTILIATGTHPNTTIVSEDAEHFKLNGTHFVLVDEKNNPVVAEKTPKPSNTFILGDALLNPSISHLGDMHISYSGNVVKAMASAKHGWEIIERHILNKVPNSDLQHTTFFNKLDKELIAIIEDVKKLTTNVLEIVVKAPLAAKKFQPGQFYRLQNYSKTSKNRMEGVALTGAWVNKGLGLVGVIILKSGASSDICATLKKGDIVSFMGPTGTPTEIPKNKNVMLVGGGLGNAVLFSIGKALRENGCRVLYFAGYRKAIDRYKIDEIEEAADSVIWCCQEDLLKARRSSDYSIIGNIIDGIASYDGTLMKLNEIDHIIVIGSDKMMKAFEEARHSRLKNLFKWPHVAIASINSPMQCMMKEICAQCLQRHVDPVTKKESYVYSCKQQDQVMDLVDFNHLGLRLSQNSLQEKFVREMRLNSPINA